MSARHRGVDAASELSALFDAAAPLIELRQNASGESFQEGQVSVVSTPAPESRLSDLLEQRGRAAQVQLGVHEDRIACCRIVHGFPAFRIGGIHRWHESFERSGLRSHERTEHARIPDLLPSEVSLGPEWDPVRRIVALGIALGIIRSSKTGFRYGKIALGRERRDVYATLKSFSGADLKRGLAESIEQVPKDQRLRDTLLMFMANSSSALDDVERGIVSAVCAELSPIS